jgi:hypothetical protein
VRAQKVRHPEEVARAAYEQAQRDLQDAGLDLRQVVHDYWVAVRDLQEGRGQAQEVQRCKTALEGATRKVRQLQRVLREKMRRWQEARKDGR